jgi:hypothetical protein
MDSQVVVSIKEIVDELDVPEELFLSYVDRETGKVHSFSRELLSFMEDGGQEDEVDDDELEDFKLVNLIFQNDRMLRLPTSREINEWSIMEEFAENIGAKRARKQLLDALHGRGAFRRFKDTACRLGIEKDWFRYRDQALRNIAIEWCEENGLEYTD